MTWVVVLLLQYWNQFTVHTCLNDIASVDIIAASCCLLIQRKPAKTETCLLPELM